jgi:hypothetical protein
MGQQQGPLQTQQVVWGRPPVRRAVLAKEGDGNVHMLVMRLHIGV